MHHNHNMTKHLLMSLCEPCYIIRTLMIRIMVGIDYEMNHS
jgi:hypothetical protein